MDYKSELRALQIALTGFQRYLIEHEHKILVLFEGRDAAGKDGTIKRIAEHLSPRETRTVALGVPSDHDRRSWYFKRYVAQLPAARELVLFNRSWYNRAGVERVMGFCTIEEYSDFMQQVVPFEELLIASGIQILKYYLDISRSEQTARLDARKANPLKQWKASPVDAVAVQHWDAYSQARNDMLMNSASEAAPWMVVRADNKRLARINVLRDLLSRIDCPSLDTEFEAADPNIVWRFTGKDCLEKLA
jgi:polyphosphate kinase 2